MLQIYVKKLLKFSEKVLTRVRNCVKLNTVSKRQSTLKNKQYIYEPKWLYKGYNRQKKTK